MKQRIRPVGHEDRLTLVEHLDELRTRIIISIAAIFVAFGALLVAEPPDPRLDERPAARRAGADHARADGALPHDASPLPLYMALLIALPVVLYQIYAFVLPAFSPTERRVATPLLLLVPVLFIGGVVFCYFVVLTPAIDFLLSFNADEFNTELRARDYYSFAALSMLAMGLLFQIPVGILAATRLGITTPEKLRKNRRYAILGMAVLAALLPTIDPVTLILEMVPLILLYELSILLAAAFGRPPEDVAEPATSTEP